MVGLIGAMTQEVADLKNAMTNPRTENHSGQEFSIGRLNGREVAIVQSGVGKVNAAIAAEILCEIYHVEALINTGVGGSLDADIEIGDIVLSTDCVEHDMDVTGLGYPKGVIPDMDPACSENPDHLTLFQADSSLLKKAETCCRRVNPEIGVWKGRIASGDVFVSGKEQKEAIRKETGALCAEMEGASIAHVASLNQTPFLIIRAVSDKADDSAHEDYPSFQKKAIQHTVRLVTALMEPEK